MSEEYELTSAGKQYVAELASLGATEEKALKDFNALSSEMKQSLIDVGMVRRKVP